MSKAKKVTADPFELEGRPSQMNVSTTKTITLNARKNAALMSVAGFAAIGGGIFMAIQASKRGGETMTQLVTRIYNSTQSMQDQDLAAEYPFLTMDEIHECQKSYSPVGIVAFDKISAGTLNKLQNYITERTLSGIRYTSGSVALCVVGLALLVSAWSANPMNKKQTSPTMDGWGGPIFSTIILCLLWLGCVAGAVLLVVARLTEQKNKLTTIMNQYRTGEKNRDDLRSDYDVSKISPDKSRILNIRTCAGLGKQYNGSCTLLKNIPKDKVDSADWCTLNYDSNTQEIISACKSVAYASFEEELVASKKLEWYWIYSFGLIVFALFITPSTISHIRKL